jgi:undecaprenyl diphosphate synthase
MFKRMTMLTHLAIIMDGNGRWAQERGLERSHGHRAGVAAMRRIVQAAPGQGIEVLSLFAFSRENWQRPISEVELLLALFLEVIRNELAELKALGVRLCFIGERDQFREELQTLMTEAEAQTKTNQKLILNVALNYSGRWDILQACDRYRTWANQTGLPEGHLPSEREFSAFLALPHAPDLLIRTSGELRISNFFLWQLAYSELFFTPVYWPDFSEAHLAAACADYAQRQRRFGGLAE